MFGMAGMYRMNDLLNLIARESADGVRLEPGRPPVMELQGKQRVLDAELVTSDNVSELIRGIATEEQRRELDLCGDLHFILVAENLARFSVRAALQGGKLSLQITNVGR